MLTRFDENLVGLMTDMNEWATVFGPRPKLLRQQQAKAFAMKYTYDHPRPSVVADIVLFGIDKSALQVLLIRRLHTPFQDSWALPGGFVGPNEELLDAAQRELAEETGLFNVELKQFHAFGALRRDPRGHVISIAHVGLIAAAGVKLRPASDAADVSWFDVTRLPPLAFDHVEIIRLALHRIREWLRYEPVDKNLLPRKFTLEKLRETYEILLGIRLDAGKFKLAILRSRILRQNRASIASEPTSFSFDAKEFRQAAHGNWLLDLPSLAARTHRRKRTNRRSGLL